MSREQPLAIVGAGLTGLCLAHALRHLDIHCFLLDKGRKPGGRMATMAHENVPIDYGPGWFHTDDSDTLPEIREALRFLQAEEVETKDLPDGVRLRIPASDRIRSWHVPTGIRRIAERLADSLDVSLGHLVRRIEPTLSGWRISGTVEANHGHEFSRQASGLVLTQPWPQTRELLEKSGPPDLSVPVKLPSEMDYERVMVLVLESDDFPVIPGPPSMGEFAGGGPIRSIRWPMAGQPEERRILTIFADPHWSSSHWDESVEEVRGQLLEALEAIFGRSVQAVLIRRHRWKYARMADSAMGNAGPAILSADPLAIAAGEAFGVTPESPAGLLSAQASARLAATIVRERASGLPGGS